MTGLFNFHKTSCYTKNKRSFRVANLSKSLDLVYNDEYKKLEINIQLDPTLLQAVNQYGWGLLTQSTYYNAFGCVKALVEASVDVNMRGRDENTSLMYAVSNSLYDIAEYLLKNGANVSLRNTSGNSVFDCILRKDSKSIDIFYGLLTRYKNHFNAEGLTLYKEFRLPALFSI
jgi:ankyrin repeat protein